MRVLELTAHLQTISRRQGRTATAVAAYRACTLIACEREGVVHDYRRKSGLEGAGIVVPDHAPAWASSRSHLWNAAELRERNGPRGASTGLFKRRATVARELVFGFPAELSPAGRLALAERVARHLVAAHGVGVDFALHAPGKLGDRRNHHCHMTFTTRRFTADGLGEKTREWDERKAGPRIVSALRAFLAQAMNEALAQEGHGAAVHVEHRSLKARGSSKVPTRHQGPGRTNALRQRQLAERQAWERETRQRQADRHGREQAELAAEHKAHAAMRHADIDARERRAIEAARNQAEPPQPQLGGLARMVRGFITQQRQSAAAPPSREAEQRVSALQAAFRAERDQVRVDQGRDARNLAERHRADDRQLDRAAEARVDRDRAAEVQGRQAMADGRVRTHARDLEQVQELRR